MRARKSEPAPRAAGTAPRHADAPWKIIAAAALLVVTIFAAYHNSFSGPFIFDDGPAIATNPTIRHLSALGDVLSPPRDAGQTVGGRPLVNLSLALNYAIGGTEPRGYHVFNFTIHLLAALTLFGIVRRTLHRTALRARFGDAALPLALAVAVLWAVHPLLTESVTYVIQRAESLMGLFYLLTLYCFIRATEAASSIAWPILTFVACLLGMATKEVMVSAPLLVLLYDRTFVAGTFREAWTRRWRLYASLAATWLLLAYLVHNAANRGGTAGLGLGDSTWTYALIQTRAITHYLWLAVWPHPLVFDYGMGLSEEAVGAAPFALIVLTVVAGTIVALRRWPMVGFLGVWFFAILAPSSSVIPIPVQPMAEHRMYLSLAALVALVVAVAYARLRHTAWFALVPIALVLGFATISRNEDYRSAHAIWSDTVAKRPQNARAQTHLADTLVAEDRLDESLAHYQEAARLESSASSHRDRTILGEILVNYGNALMAAGRPADATSRYEEALRVDPSLAVAAFNLGCVLMDTGQLPEAATRFEQALRANPDYTPAHNNLGSVLLRQGRTAEALTHYEAALRLERGSAKAHVNLGNALLRARRLPEALTHLEEAVRLQPDFALAHAFLGETLAALGRRAEALTHYETVVRLEPDNEPARRALASLRSL